MVGTCGAELSLLLPIDTDAKHVTHFASQNKERAIVTNISSVMINMPEWKLEESVKVYEGRGKYIEQNKFSVLY